MPLLRALVGHDNIPPIPPHHQICPPTLSPRALGPKGSKFDARHPYKFNILVTTYDEVIKDVEELSAVPWRVVVIDEAHRIKNEASLFARTARSLRAERRLLVTGTPLQNNTVSFAINQARKQDSERASTSTHQQACQNLPVAVSFF